MGGIPTPEATTAVADAARALEADVSGWQPIETAQKDGAPVLLWVSYAQWRKNYPSAFGQYADHALTARWHMPGGRPSQNGYWELLQAGGYAEDDEVSGNPTHWHRLPEPPR